VRALRTVKLHTESDVHGLIESVVVEIVFFFRARRRCVLSTKLRRSSRDLKVRVTVERRGCRRRGARERRTARELRVYRYVGKRGLGKGPGAELSFGWEWE